VRGFTGEKGKETKRREMTVGALKRGRVLKAMTFVARTARRLASGKAHRFITEKEEEKKFKGGAVGK